MTGVSHLAHLRLRHALVALAVASFSCTFVDGALRPVEGRYINEEFVSAIVDGRTTANDLREQLGEPLQVHEADGLAFWRYYSLRTAVSTERALFMSRRHYFTEEQELAVTINRDGVVIAHAFKRDGYHAVPRRSMSQP